MSDLTPRSPGTAIDPPRGSGRLGSGPALDPEVVIQATGLHKRFIEHSGDAALKVHVLQGVDLTVRRGETIAVVGASGSGKSTLLHLIGGLEAPSGGHVELAGHDFAGMNATMRNAADDDDGVDAPSRHAPSAAATRSTRLPVRERERIVTPGVEGSCPILSY